MHTDPQPAPWHQRPLWSAGFRPFFLAAASHGLLVVGLWVATLRGLGLPLPAAYFGPSVWHAHELIQGFTVAVIAGFLLTAVQRWTAVPMPQGRGLAALLALWGAGRLASASAGLLPGPLVALVDLSFLPALAAVVGRAIWMSSSRRNYFIPCLLMALWVCSLSVHLQAIGLSQASAQPALTAAVYLLLTLILVITGRIVPLFTRNATQRSQIHSSILLDRAAVLTTLGVGAAVTLRAPAAIIGALALAATGAIIGRAWRWGARYTRDEPLLWVLHLGHAWAALAMALRVLATWTRWITPLTALHAATVGTVSLLCFGMMARVALGHTGRALRAPKLARVSFALIALAAALRIVGPGLRDLVWGDRLLAAAGLAWCGAAALYLIDYAPILLAPEHQAPRAGIPLPLSKNT